MSPASASRFFTTEPLGSLIVSRPAIKPAPPALKVWSLNHQAAREVQILTYLRSPGVQEILELLLHGVKYKLIYSHMQLSFTEHLLCPQDGIGFWEDKDELGSPACTALLRNMQ